MAWYRAFICGENFRLELDGKTGTFGFYTNRFVEAGSPELAEGRAVEAIRSDPALRDTVKNDPADPPAIHIEELEEIDAAEVPGTAQGLAFFEEE